MEKIDIVITWVDGKDKEWLKERAKYITTNEKNNNTVGGDNRYLDNGLFKYLFRGIDKYAKWVNKVYLVTWGHLPEWINKQCDKLIIVNHKDFIPKKYLPTFNSEVIALNLHRIKGLSNKFIYFNDDMYLVNDTQSDLFFKKGLPCDTGVFDIMASNEVSPYYHTCLNDMFYFNKNYQKNAVIKSNFLKFFNLRYGKYVFKNVLLLPFKSASVFYEPHLPASYLKTEFDKVWTQCEEICEKTCQHKIRTFEGISENLVRYFQFGDGLFTPLNRDHYGRFVTFNNRNIESIIKNKKIKYVCINDIGSKEQVNYFENIFKTIFPDKSCFEK